MKLPYGSIEESIAITAYNRERNIQYLSALFSIVGPDDKQKIMNSYRGVVFPEEEHSDHLYVKQAQRTFERMRDIKINVTSLDAPKKETWITKKDQD